MRKGCDGGEKKKKTSGNTDNCETEENNNNMEIKTIISRIDEVKPISDIANFIKQSKEWKICLCGV